MRFNERCLRYSARHERADKEGRLNYRGPKESYRERWFKLRGNLLYYFRTNDKGSQAESEALGLLVIERCHIQLEPLADMPFVFSVAFDGESGQKHFFSGQTERQCRDWVSALQMASTEKLRSRLMFLQTKILQRTGKDPLDELVAAEATTLSVRTSPSQRHTVPKAANSTFHRQFLMQTSTSKGTSKSALQNNRSSAPTSHPSTAQTGVLLPTRPLNSHQQQTKTKPTSNKVQSVGYASQSKSSFYI